MRKKALLIWIALVSSSWIAMGQEIYRWVDEKGTVHFADDITLVPERYRDQIQQRKLPEKPASPPARPFTEPRPERPITEPAPIKKDALGRGEDWWRAKMKEWEDKLQNTQKSADLVFSEIRQKEKELADAKFKSDYIKRKLKAEIKALEEKLKEQERMRDEAKNMIEKILPKEAEDYRADPAWLKPKE